MVAKQRTFRKSCRPGLEASIDGLHVSIDGLHVSIDGLHVSGLHGGDRLYEGVHTLRKVSMRCMKAFIV
jgi:hypothetical protein